MKAPSIFVIASLLITSAFGQTNGLAPLPAGKAIKLEIETYQSIAESYYVANPDVSKDSRTMTFHHTYISDNERFRISMEQRIGNPPKFYSATTVAYDGTAIHTLSEPNGTLVIRSETRDIRSPHTGEKILSPLHVFYSRNPMIAMSHWQISDLREEAKLFTFDWLLKSDRALDDVRKSASPKLVANRGFFAANARGFDPAGTKKPSEFLMMFDLKTKDFSGWRSEAGDKSGLREFTVNAWKDFECGDGLILKLPQQTTLTYSHDKTYKGNYKLWITWNMKIVSATLVNAAEPYLFAIDPSTVTFIDDQISGRSGPGGRRR